MHMADALLSPAVGGALWATAAGATCWSAARLRREMDERKPPLMGVLGAFVFAAQMINFTIPGTGSSGHLGGGMLLAILLGPHAAFLVIASVLAVQALLFADGGLLALGANIANLGILPCFVAYPLLFRPLAGANPSGRRLAGASIVASVAALQLGAFGVVVETVLSGISELPLQAFALAMLPIHLAIGVVEGIVTAAVVTFVLRARPELAVVASATPARGNGSLVAVLALAALATGGVFSWFASESPDGLEWSVARVSGSEELPEATDALHGSLAAAQEQVAPLPDYALPPDAEGPGARAGTSLAGIVGAAVVAAIVLAGALVLQRIGARKVSAP